MTAVDIAARMNVHMNTVHNWTRPTRRDTP